MINNTDSAQISQKPDRRNIYAIMKTMCPPGYHHNGFLATPALGHMMNNVATVHHVPKYIIFHRVILVTTRPHIIFMIAYIYIYYI